MFRAQTLASFNFKHYIVKDYKGVVPPSGISIYTFAGDLLKWTFPRLYSKEITSQFAWNTQN
jgi:hypothetical protein